MTTPDQTHQVSERPHSAMAVTHWVWSQGCCRGCGTWSTAPRPPAQATGAGPRCRARSGARAGTSGTGRRMVQTLWASVLRVPLRVGASQQGRDRVPPAIAPP